MRTKRRQRAEEMAAKDHHQNDYSPGFVYFPGLVCRNSRTGSNQDDAHSREYETMMLWLAWACKVLDLRVESAMKGGGKKSAANIQIAAGVVAVIIIIIIIMRRRNKASNRLGRLKDPDILELRVAPVGTMPVMEESAYVSTTRPASASLPLYARMADGYFSRLVGLLGTTRRWVRPGKGPGLSRPRGSHHWYEYALDLTFLTAIHKVVDVGESMFASFRISR